MAWNRRLTTSARCAIVNARHPEAQSAESLAHSVGPVRPVRLNNLHKHSHGLLISATSPASDLGLCLGLEPLRNTMLLIGDDEVVENAFSNFSCHDAGKSLPVPKM